MKLRYYAAFVTWVLVIILITGGMWEFTQKDVLEIFIVTAMFSPLFPLAVLALTETDEEEEEAEQENHRKRYFRIYTLKEENHYGRRIS
ncbi:MAG: hypothetical protein IJV14_03155 [Lachnospiraceae bacterium]|nr:hypothetical protein [Lachnospiraceae bacterium]